MRLERKEYKAQWALRDRILFPARIEYRGEEKNGNYVFLQEPLFLWTSLQWKRELK